MLQASPSYQPNELTDEDTDERQTNLFSMARLTALTPRFGVRWVAVATDYDGIRRSGSKVYFLCRSTKFDKYLLGRWRELETEASCQIWTLVTKICVSYS